ncbi:ATP-binding protein [Anaerolineales bacterium HSG24]|nr:ATP-binding protein [Anaerolineales bacterium HSG24]
MTENKETILAVDDIPANLGLLVDFLEQKGFEVLVAEDSESAIDLLNHIKPDIILLDIMMPGMDGFETCRWLKNQPEFKDIPVIFMTALSETTDKIKAFRAGAVDFITKPFQYEEVLARLLTHLTIRNLQQQMLTRQHEQREIMAQIERSKQLLWAVIDSTPIDWIFAKDKELRYIIANQTLAKSFNLIPHLVIGKNDLEIGFSEEYVFGNAEKGIANHQKDDEYVLQGNVLHNPSEQIVDANGVMRILDTYKTPFYSKDGQIFGLIGISRDVTEQRKLEEELETYRFQLEKMIIDRTERLEFIAHLSGHLNEILDLRQLLIELVNQLQTIFSQAHIHIYLFDEENNNLVMTEGTGQAGQQLKEQEYRQEVGHGIIGTVFKTGKYFLNQNIQETDVFIANPLLPDIASELAVPIRKAGNLIGVLDIQSKKLNAFSSEDVSMMQLIADQSAIAIDNARLLAERQSTIMRLREVDQAKSQFITMMSHELRTPLNAINGFAELLMLGLSGDLPNQAQEDIQLIYDSGQHLLNLINDVLDISQIEAGQIQIEPEILSVKEVMQDVQATSIALVQNKPIQLLIDVPEVIPDVWADRTRLKQILLNLVGNAIKFTQKGQITIKVTKLDLHWSATEALDQSNQIVFSVIDSGIGISADKRQVIFEQFQQADMSDSREYGGTGLGLTICQQLVQMHNGKLGVKSEESIGSEFYFSLPIAKESYRFGG